MVLAATDALDWPSPLGEALLRLRHLRHDVRLLALRTQAEAKAQFPNSHSYRDPEQPGVLHRFGAAERDAYVAALGAHFDGVATSCRQHDVPLCVATIEQPVSAVLRDWLRPPSSRKR